MCFAQALRARGALQTRLTRPPVDRCACTHLPAACAAQKRRVVLAQGTDDSIWFKGICMLPGCVGNNHTVVPRRCDALMCPVKHVHDNYNPDCMGNREARTAYRAAPHPVLVFAALSEAAVASSGGRVKIRVRTSLNPDFSRAHVAC